MGAAALVSLKNEANGKPSDGSDCDASFATAKAEVVRLRGLISRHRASQEERTGVKLSAMASSMEYDADAVRLGVYTGPKALVLCELNPLADSVANALLARHPNAFRRAVETSTLAHHSLGVEGLDYVMETKETMARELAQGLYYCVRTDNAGEFYGTKINAISEVRSSGKICLLSVQTMADAGNHYIIFSLI